jgi:hypothetical protein
VVSGVTSFGLFVELNDSKVNGLVHVTQLPHDYYHFDPLRKSLKGERKGLGWRLGDPVRVMVMRASVEDRRIDFKLVLPENGKEEEGLGGVGGMSKGIWIAGINAVASALEHDIERVHEVLLEAGGKNPRLADIEDKARRNDISVRRVPLQALDGVAGGLRHQGAIARYEAPRRSRRASCRRCSKPRRARRWCWCSTACRIRTTSVPACAAPPPPRSPA